MDEQTYDPTIYPSVFVTVDIVVFTLVDAQVPHRETGEARKQLSLALIQRGAWPFEGAWALPGGFIVNGEDLVDAARRELAEEVGIDLDDARLHQLGAYGAPDRDPRRRVVTVAYVALVHDLPALHAGSDASHAQLVPYRDLVDGEIELAFDHQLIVDDALEHVRRLIEETDAALDFCPAQFTINDLRDVYEAVWREPVERTGFQKKVRAITDFIEPIPMSGRASAEFAADSMRMELPSKQSMQSVSRMVVDPTAFSSMSMSNKESMAAPFDAFDDDGVQRSKPVRGRPPQYFSRGGAHHLDPPLRRPKPRTRASRTSRSQRDD